MSKNDPDNWMWVRAQQLLDQADRMQRQFFHPARPGTKRPCWEPPADVFETATELWVQVALPGVEPERVRVELDGGEVRVVGHRRQPAAFRNASVHRLEIPHGNFERRVPLPPGTYELRETKLLHGCLLLNLRKLD